MAAKDKPANPDRKWVTVHKKARLKYEVLDSFEAGIVLVGTEVKSLRAGHVHIDEAYGRIDDGELYLIGAHIEEYLFGNRQNHVPTRRRKLLLKRFELKKLLAKVKQKGFTLVPLSIHFNDRGFAKVTIGLCVGKKLHDKRDTIRKKEAQTEMRGRV
jgi:SsrA-binding protein